MPAQPCPDYTYSLAASVFVEDCTSNNLNNSNAILISLALSFVVICSCILLCYDYCVNRYNYPVEYDCWENPCPPRRRCSEQQFRGQGPGRGVIYTLP